MNRDTRGAPLFRGLKPATREAAVRLGPTFIKLGQALSIRYNVSRLVLDLETA